MARAKKEAALTPEERLQAALVPDWEWPYKLPENWCWTRHNSIMDIVGGAQPEKAFFIREPKEGYVQLYQTRDYGENPVPVYIPQKYATKTTDEGDILLARYGGSLGKVFRAHKGAYNVALAKVIILYPEVVDDEFLYLYYYSHFYQDFCIKAGYGRSAQAGFNKSDLNELLFPLPPLAEQHRIVDRIESLFAKLDEAKEKAQAVVDSFETRKAAILHKAFTGELTAKWREEHYATDNTVLMDIKNYSSSWSAKEKDLLSREQAKSDVVVLDNGHEWIRCTIGAVGRVTNGSTPLRKEPKYWSGKIPWISSGEVRNNIIESSNECISEEGYANSSVKLLPIGTVLIAMIGEGKTRGQSAILNIEATINQNVAAIVVEHNCVLPYYIWYWLQMNYAKNREKGSGSGPQALNCQRVRELDFFVPNLKEQKEVVNILRKALAKEQQSKEAAEAVLDQIDLMKKSILARAFRGELGTNDPSEESAVELLKEIIRRG